MLGLTSITSVSSFPETGNWTAPAYAASVAGVLPTTDITWFQAEQACALAGKRLITNQEWQRAAAGTPDPGDSDDNSTQCETGVGESFTDAVTTGSRVACVSNWGAYDMVGNATEWVADWDEGFSAGCTNWFGGIYGNDKLCLGGNGTGNAGPAALRRGGSWSSGSGAGVFAVENGKDLAEQEGYIGFRCAR